MRKLNRIHYGMILLCAVVLLAWSPNQTNAAAEVPPSLLITEIMSDSPGADDPYRYIELYNNTGRSINLADMKILYYWQAVSNDPWANSSVTPYEIVSAGRTDDMYIRPYDTKVVWLLSDPTKTTADFNAAYGTSLDDNDFVYIQGSGWAHTNQRYFAVASAPYDKVQDRITFARYNESAGLGSCSGASCDFTEGESVEYYYPRAFNTTSREMERRDPGSYHRTPTPGSVSQEQVPTVPGKLLITEAMIHSPGTNSPYRYLEIYNNSGNAIDLSQHKIMYYWQAVNSEPWLNSSATSYDIISAGRTNDMFIQPYSTKVVWLLSDATKTVADFNSAYGTSLSADNFVYIQGSGWSFTQQRYFSIVAAPYDQVVNRHSFVRYNADAGLGACSGATCDFSQGESVHYYAPANFDTASREMVRKAESFGMPGSPGTLADWQVPPPPVTQTEMTFSTTKVTVNYDEFFDISSAGPVIPGLDEGYVQQGVDYYPAKDWILITYYHDSGQPSIIAVVDRTTGQFVKAVKMFKDAATPYDEHAAGIAVSDVHGWIASWKYAYQFKLEDLENAVHMDTLVFSDAIELESKSGSMGYEDGILWIGEYGRYNYSTDTAHHMTNRMGRTHKAWMVGFKLNSDDTIDPTRKRPGTNQAVPDYILSIPDEIQGMDMIGDKVILSKSYGPQYDSELLVYDLDLSGTPDATTNRFGSPEVPIWFLDNMNLVKSLRMPPQSEGIFAYDGNVYVSFESAGPKYSDTSIYPSVYPLDRIYLTDAVSLTSAVPPAQVTPGDLLITETVLNSTGHQDYRYIELYNNSGQTIDLTDHLITYYWKIKETAPWEYELFQFKLHDAGRGADMTISPGDTKIVWLLSNPDRTISDFNSHYGTSLASDQFVYITTAPATDIHAYKERLVGIIGPLGNKDVDRYSTVWYNVGSGDSECTQGTSCDASDGESIVYYYPASFDPVDRLMERRVPDSLRQTPTPGALVTGQIP
ncbi:lamin tail domain-containing protein [Paenibacillus sp. J2TS4]|uniref:lamin tail domain-containing protein n=1 Tax=Paenibacillus sp. J2TS4 TaxID=2807194 RepID=UPI001B046EFF|nr:lamin tail domain-containing protein [Paenibacillus sp. J2TS4]GIP36138.1 hypothetical protein J2TS4_53480 [Paenibacillus sp. J2TS4]